MEYKIERCEICNKSIQEIGKEIPGSFYSKEKLKKHIEQNHFIKFEDYLINYCKLEIPKCACGCGKNVAPILSSGGPIKFNKFLRYHDNSSTPGHKVFCLKMKETRKGSGNPMYKKTPWNKGVHAENDIRMKNLVEKMRTRVVSEKTRDIYRKNILEGRNPNFHHKMPHSEETKEKIRQKTLAQIKRGCFNQLKSSCHLVVTKILQEWGIKFEEEKTLGVFSYDIYLIDFNVYIEIDGDYWHSNPKFYPDGPKTSAQKVNFYRDKMKDKFGKEKNIIVYRFWEYDINNNLDSVKEKLKGIICKHQELKKLEP